MFLPKKRIAVFICLLVASVLIWLIGIHQHLTFENITENRDMLLSFVDQNYILSVFIFLTAMISTAFFIPGTLALTVASGFFFGFIAGMFYALLGACLGAIMAFLASRYLIGSWIQHKLNNQLETFNKEISRHGHNYLLFFRIVPVLPFFVVNYLAGITNISAWTFLWTTAVGMLPGALVCTFAGQQLGIISSLDRIFSTEVIIAFILLAALILLPPAVRHTKKIFT
jgi:uncharacterized membrane protein YdjX (TVP38/TMEM64 family)